MLRKFKRSRRIQKPSLLTAFDCLVVRLVKQLSHYVLNKAIKRLPESVGNLPQSLLLIGLSKYIKRKVMIVLQSVWLSLIKYWTWSYGKRRRQSCKKERAEKNAFTHEVAENSSIILT